MVRTKPNPPQISMCNLSSLQVTISSSLRIWAAVSTSLVQIRTHSSTQPQEFSPPNLNISMEPRKHLLARHTALTRQDLKTGRTPPPSPSARRAPAPSSMEPRPTAPWPHTTISNPTCRTRCSGWAMGLVSAQVDQADLPPQHHLSHLEAIQRLLAMPWVLGANRCLMRPWTCSGTTMATA